MPSNPSPGIPRPQRIALLTLFLGAFVLGSSETMPVGLLTDIAESTQSEIGHAGILVTAYAIAFATGGIALSFVTASWSRRLLLFASLAAALLSNLVLAYSNDLALLIAVRIADGSAQGWFVGAAIAVAMSVVPPDRFGRAISIVVSGFAASTALGVPAGVGFASAYGWHASFLAVSVLVLVVISGVAISIPSSIKSPVAPANNAEQIRYALSPRVLAILAVTMILFAGETRPSPTLARSCSRLTAYPRRP